MKLNGESSLSASLIAVKILYNKSDKNLKKFKSEVYEMLARIVHDMSRDYVNKILLNPTPLTTMFAMHKDSPPLESPATKSKEVIKIFDDNNNYVHRSQALKVGPKLVAKFSDSSATSVVVSMVPLMMFVSPLFTSFAVDFFVGLSSFV